LPAARRCQPAGGEAIGLPAISGTIVLFLRYSDAVPITPTIRKRHDR
jgi:hypothetical protein